MKTNHLSINPNLQIIFGHSDFEIIRGDNLKNGVKYDYADTDSIALKMGRTNWLVTAMGVVLESIFIGSSSGNIFRNGHKITFKHNNKIKSIRITKNDIEKAKMAVEMLSGKVNKNLASRE